VIVIFRVVVGLQVSYFEADTYLAAVKAAASSGLPLRAVAEGAMYLGQDLDTDSVAQEYLDNLQI